jgi:hypothetical protein
MHGWFLVASTTFGRQVFEIPICVAACAACTGVAAFQGKGSRRMVKVHQAIKTVMAGEAGERKILQVLSHKFWFGLLVTSFAIDFIDHKIARVVTAFTRDWLF